MKSRSSGFTLVELLICLAMVAVLAAILLTVFSRVREQGRASDCQSNLKQIALAVQLYIQDNNGSLPGWTYPSYLREYIHLTPSQKNPYHCLTHPLVDMNDENTQVDYTYNAALSSHELYHLPVGSQEYVFQNAADTWLNTDANDRERQYEQDVSPSVGHPCSFSIWHSGGANFSFLDGHVKWLRPESACGIDNSHPLP